jgi:hypothetical protein
MDRPTYFDKFENLAFSRDEYGVLVLGFHTVVFTGLRVHSIRP